MGGPDQVSSVRRTWPQRLAIAISVTAAVVSFLAAGGLAGAYFLWSDRDTVNITNPAAAANAPVAPLSTATVPPTSEPADTEPDGSDVAAEDSVEATEPATTPPTTPPATFPPADPTAKNFLITGADNGACIDPDSPYAGAFGTEGEDRVGERSDTIMVLRVDPAASRVAVLSFPRDLYVRLPSGNRGRINSAYERDDPQRLINTIFENFDVGVDHFIQVDFCTFKTLVDAVGGVTVPFEFPARDRKSGLEVLTTGCYTFSGDHALAYVRSRSYEYEDPPGSGNWVDDESVDLGRVSRQQDFLRRTLASVLAKGLLNPDVARGLIETATGGDVVTDSGLSVAKLMEFAGVMRNVAPGGIPTYQIEAEGRDIGGASVLVPAIEGDNMQAVLGMFRGETSLGEAPVQEFATTTTPDTRPGATPATTSTTSTTGATGTTLRPPPDGGPEENTFGIVPPRDEVC
ncbi:MAG: LCP family protein [Ilumatobacteraceae bacterium]